jgi:hypothetical protein
MFRTQKAFERSFRDLSSPNSAPPRIPPRTYKWLNDFFECTH